MGFPLEPLEAVRPCQKFDFRFQAFERIGKQVIALLTHPCGDNFLWQPWEVHEGRLSKIVI